LKGNQENNGQNIRRRNEGGLIIHIDRKGRSAADGQGFAGKEQDPICHTGNMATQISIGRGSSSRLLSFSVRSGFLFIVPFYREPALRTITEYISFFKNF
jgi:hypothetical protein